MTQRKATAEEIKRVQEALQARGLYEGAIDGISGADTRAAVAKLQVEMGLPLTGILGVAEMTELGLVALFTPKPKSNPFTNFFVRKGVEIVVSNLLKGLPMLTALSGYKTYITGAVMVLVGAASLVSPIVGLGAIPGLDVLTPGEAWTSMTTGFGLIFLRTSLKA